MMSKSPKAFSSAVCRATPEGWKRRDQAGTLTRSGQPRSLLLPRTSGWFLWALPGLPSLLSCPSGGAELVPMLKPRKQWPARALQGTLLAALSRGSAPRAAPHHHPRALRARPRPRAPLTWSPVCAEGPVDQGEVQHEGGAGVLGPGKQVALAGVLQLLGGHLDPGEGDASVQAVLLRHL